MIGSPLETETERNNRIAHDVVRVWFARERPGPFVSLQAWNAAQIALAAQYAARAEIDPLDALVSVAKAFPHYAKRAY